MYVETGLHIHRNYEHQFKQVHICVSGNRLRNVSITIGDNMDDLKLHVFHENPIGNTCTFVMAQPCRGRYVKILNDKNASLTICELQVYGN